MRNAQARALATKPLPARHDRPRDDVGSSPSCSIKRTVPDVETATSATAQVPPNVACTVQIRIEVTEKCNIRAARISKCSVMRAVEYMLSARPVRAVFD